MGTTISRTKRNGESRDDYYDDEESPRIVRYSREDSDYDNYPYNEATHNEPIPLIDKILEISGYDSCDVIEKMEQNIVEFIRSSPSEQRVDYLKELESGSGSTPLIISLRYRYFKIATELLRYPEHCNVWHVDNNGRCAISIFMMIHDNTDRRVILNEYYESILVPILNQPDRHSLAMEFRDDTLLCWACRKELSTLAMNILQYPDECNMDCLGSEGMSALAMAITRGMKKVSLEMLRYPDRCYIDTPDTGGSALYNAAMGNHISITKELLKHLDPSAINICTDGVTLLTRACLSELPEIALAFLEHPDKLNLAKRECSDDTSLIAACRMGLTDIALKILEHPYRCGLNKFNHEKMSALDYAHDNEMTEVENKIIDYVDIKRYIRRGKNDELADLFLSLLLEDRIDILKNPESIREKRVEVLALELRTKSLEKRAKSVSRDGECMTCCEETRSHIMFLDCRHIICVCNECADKLEETCPLCRKVGPIIKDCFIV